MKKTLTLLSNSKIYLLFFMTLIFGSLLTCCGTTSPLQLELQMDKTSFSPNEAITCKAVLKYTGSESNYTFYSGEPIIMFSISGDKYFNGESDLINKGLYKQIILKDEPIEVPFTSYIGWHLNSDQDAVDFWNSFSNNKELMLPAGEYVLMAKVIYYREQGTRRTILSDNISIIVG